MSVASRRHCALTPCAGADEEAPVEAPVEVPSSRSRRRQLNLDAEDSADAAGVGTSAQEVAPEAVAAVRRARFQPSAVKEGDESEDAQKDNQSDIHPQELAQMIRSKSEIDRAQTSIIEISIPSARINTAEDPPLQLLHVTKNDFTNQVSLRCSPVVLLRRFTSSFSPCNHFSGASQRAVLCHP